MTPRRTRATRRLVGTLLMAAAIYAVGANVAAGWVIAVGATIGALTIFSAVSHLRGVRGLTIDVQPPRRADEADGTIHVTVYVPRRVVGTVRQAGVDGVLAAVLPEGTGHHVLDVPVRLERGTDQRLTFEVDLTDPLGVVTTTFEVSSPSMTVRPAPRAEGTPARGQVEPTPVADETHTRRGATPDTELRPWRPGEPVRLVHWPTSLRTGELQARHTVDEARPRVTLGIPDGRWDREELDRRCRAVRAEAERQDRLGVDVTVIADGVEVPWGPDALDLLASLPPHAAAEPRHLGGDA